MLEISTYNSGNSYVLTIRLIRYKAADTTDNQINFNTHLTCLIKCFYHTFIL